MKHLYFFIVIMLFWSCKEYDPSIEDLGGDKIAFQYEVADDQYKTDFYIGSQIQFKNTSEETGKCIWDFGDGTTSEEENPIHRYKNAQTYKVKLTIDGVGSVTRNLLISDLYPKILVDEIEGDGICEVAKTPIDLKIFLPNPENLPEEYEWQLPVGTTTLDGQPLTTFKGKDIPTLMFGNVGSQKVVLKTYLGGRRLQDGVFNVQVGYSEPVNTLYYAEKDGNMKALKIVPNKPESMEISPFDLGFKSGNHPLNLFCDDSLIYILDAGKQMTWIDDKGLNLGDGKLSVVSKDGKTIETLYTNNGGYAFDDPFYGYLDKANKTIYVSDRNTGIAKFSTELRNGKIQRTDTDTRTSYDYWVKNNRLLYYNSVIAWGCMNAGIEKINDVWYWCKTSNGIGVLRFKESDITTYDISTGKKDEPYPLLLSGLFVKSMVYDKVRDRLYFVVRSPESHGGLYVTTLATFNALSDSKLSGLEVLKNSVAAKTSKLISRFIADDEGVAGEEIDVCQLALDPDDGSIYFGLRAGTASALTSGLYVVNYNSDLNQTGIKSLIDKILVYGLTVNNKKSKLF